MLEAFHTGIQRHGKERETIGENKILQWWLMPKISALGRLGQKGWCEFKTSRGCVVSFKPF